MARLVLLAIGCTVSLLMLTQASASNGGKKILDLRVLNQIMDGITQLNNHLRHVIDILKQVADMKRYNPLPDIGQGITPKRRRPTPADDSIISDMESSSVRRALSRDFRDFQENGNENTNTNINTNTNLNGNSLQHFLRNQLPQHFI